MLRGIYQATSKLITNLRWQEVIEDNLSNLNTPGFREKLVAIGIDEQHVLHRVEKGQATPIGPLTFNVQIDALSYSNEQGGLKETDSPYHLAIVGDGYFSVRRPGGQVAYTRNGEFIRQPDGTLALADGSVLLGQGGVPIRVPEDIYIDPAGRMFNGGGQYLGVIPTYNLTGITDIGGGFYTGGAALSNSVILQGYLEEPNVDVIKEMTDMIRAERSFQAASKVVRTEYDTVGRLINTVS